MKGKLIIVLLIFCIKINAQNNYATNMCSTVMNIWKDSFALDGKPAKWTYDMGVVLKAMEGVWMNTTDVKYFNYIQKQIDFFVNEDGTIKTYKQEDFNIDNINNGRILLFLYKVTLKEKYLKAAKILREQLSNQPRNNEKGFWHKKIYPNQMWLDGLYMAEPFYAEYAQLANDTSAFNDIANQFIIVEKHTRDAKTGLLYHAYDESKLMKWSNPQNGCSHHFWARAMGWYATALVDVLEWFPNNNQQKKELIAILNRLVNAIEKQQDKTTGLWYDVLNYNGINKEKNYFEASASSQFVYAIAKAVRLKYIPNSKIEIAKKGYNGIVNKFVLNRDGITNLEGTVKVSGLGGNPYRDGSFNYYMSEPIITNDPKGIGTFIMASNEIDFLQTQNIGIGKTIVMDNYFNRETKQDAFGNTIVFHYKWWEKDNGGFSTMNHICNKFGVIPTSLNEGPTDLNLKNVSVYFLIDPDWPKENKNPNYIEPSHIKALMNFVNNGGVLVLMANDSNNVEFKHFNELAEKFGIHFNENVRHNVKDDIFEQGATDLSKAKEIFLGKENAYIKQMCTQTIKLPAQAVYSENGEVLMSTSKFGKGKVFAVGDPWFYNEYLDGRKLPTNYKNYSAAEELIKWSLKK